MRRKHLVLIGVIVAICVLAGYIWIARPVLVLPAVTVALPETSTISVYQRQLKISALNVILRTNGKLTLNADGQELAYVSYTLFSVKHTADLAQNALLSPTAKMAIRLFPVVFSQWAWNAFLTNQFVYYVLPVEVTVRFVRG
jgi:hypothetical protein